MVALRRGNSIHQADFVGKKIGQCFLDVLA